MPFYSDSNGWVTSSTVAGTGTGTGWPSMNQTATSSQTGFWLSPTVVASQNSVVRWFIPAPDTYSPTSSVWHEWSDHQPYISVAPAIRRQSLADAQARDQELYARALAEHDQQEAERLNRIITQRRQEIEARQVADETRRRAAEEDRERRHAANQRARALLLEHLTPSQRETFQSNGWFIVEGGRSGTRYRVRCNDGLAGNIDVLHDGRQGHAEIVRHRLCAHPPFSMVPHGDHILAQKMMLEFAEEEFLRIANRHGAMR